MKKRGPEAEVESLLEECRVELGRLRLDIPELDSLAPPLDLPPLPPWVAPPDPPTRWKRALAALGVFIAGALGGAAAMHFRSPVPARLAAAPADSFALPFSQPVGLAARGGRLFTLDETRALLFGLDAATGKVMEVRRFENPAPTGLAGAGDGYWSTEQRAGRILRHNADPDHTVAQAFSNPLGAPAALFWDGETLWTSHPAAETVYQLRVGEALKPARQFSVGRLRPSGLHVEGQRLWVFDGPTRSVHRFEIGPLLKPIDSVSVSARLEATATVTGFAVADGRLWLTTRAPAAIRSLPLASLDWKKIPALE